MIHGIGIDLVQISRIESAAERWGDRFLERVFTKSEPLDQVFVKASGLDKLKLEMIPRGVLI
jgi:holo-[acyl-carrier-protein] synthase